MVNLWFWRRSIYTSPDTPAYLFIDIDPGVNIRLKCYEGNVIYIDDTITSTNRARGLVQIWTTNPNPLPAIPIARAVMCEIYDTSNNLIKRQRLWYLYGQRIRRISFVDENNNPISVDYCVAYSYTKEQHFYECGSGYGVDDALANEPRAIIEAFTYLGGKRYFIATENALPSGDIAIIMRQGEKFYVRVRYLITLSTLNSLFNSPIITYPAQFILNNMGFIAANVAGYFASAFSQLVGISLPIVSFSISSTGGDWVLEVVYEQSIAPLLLIAIAAGAAGLIAGLFLSGVIQSIVSDVTYTVRYVSYAEAQQQRASLIQKAFEYCGNDRQCLNEVISVLDKAISSLVPPAPPPTPGIGIPHLALAGLAGIVVGGLLFRRERG